MRSLYMSLAPVTRLAMSLKQYCTLRGWGVPKNENGASKGYLVEKVGLPPNHKSFESYITWMTEEEFDTEYAEHGAAEEDDKGKINVNSVLLNRGLNRRFRR